MKSQNHFVFHEKLMSGKDAHLYLCLNLILFIEMIILYLWTR
jgi:hypothetical protein